MENVENPRHLDRRQALRALGIVAVATGAAALAAGCDNSGRDDKVFDPNFWQNLQKCHDAATRPGDPDCGKEVTWPKDSTQRNQRQR